MRALDDLAGAIREFAPGPGLRLGILVDHLIEGTKEQRIVEEALAVPGAAGHVKIVGHPFIDIWQAVKPSVLGLKAWPQVPRGEDFSPALTPTLTWIRRCSARWNRSSIF